MKNLQNIFLFVLQKKARCFCPLDLFHSIIAVTWDDIYIQLRKFGLTRTVTQRIKNLTMSDDEKIKIASNLHNQHWYIKTLKGLTISIDIDLKSMTIDDIVFNVCYTFGSGR